MFASVWKPASAVSITPSSTSCSALRGVQQQAQRRCCASAAALGWTAPGETAISPLTFAQCEDAAHLQLVTRSEVKVLSTMGGINSASSILSDTRLGPANVTPVCEASRLSEHPEIVWRSLHISADDESGERRTSDGQGATTDVSPPISCLPLP